MYNRYVRNDQGTYTRIPEEEAQRVGSTPPPGEEGRAPDAPPPHQEEPLHHAPPPPERTDGITKLLRRLLDRIHLESVDTGDLLLLILLFLLFEEDADQELLIALGLLLIL